LVTSIYLLGFWVFFNVYFEYSNDSAEAESKIGEWKEVKENFISD